MAKYSIGFAQQYARDKGGECLSESYENRCLLLWQCDIGHRWSAPLNRIVAGHWCPKCAGRSFTIDDIRDFARSKKGKCLSLNYVKSRKSLRWECHKGHSWTSSFYLAQKTWCGECNQVERLKDTLREMQNLARERGGECLSDEHSPNRKLKWRCRHGHEWEAHGYKVKRGNWCSVCSGVKKHTILDLRKVAKSRGGRILSTSYDNSHEILSWECAHGHRWEARFCDIKNNRSWCPFCSGKKTLIHMDELAREHEGVCLSTRYTNSKTELKWKCKHGHVFWRTSQSVIRGSFCAVCSSKGSEKFCRETFEKMFDLEFPQKWPEWLKRPDTGRRLQLDGYCEQLKIAFEHNGLQHYQECQRFHRNDKGLFEAQQYRDTVKRVLCEENGVFLIVIPQLGVKINGVCVRRRDLRKFIQEKIREKEVENG